MAEQKNTIHALKQLLQILKHTVYETDSSCALKVTCLSKKTFHVICIDSLIYFKDISDECSDYDEININHSHLSQHYSKTSFFSILFLNRKKVMEHIVKSMIPKLFDTYKNVYLINDADIKTLISEMLERRLNECMTTDIPENSFIDELMSDAFELVNQKYEQDLS